MNTIRRLEIDPFDLDTTFEYDVREVIELSLEEAEHLRGQLKQASLQVENYISIKEKQERVWRANLDLPF